MRITTFAHTTWYQVGPAGCADNIEQQESGLYLNDDLTRSRAQLLYECRQAKKKELIADCWSYDGSIIVKTITNKMLLSKVDCLKRVIYTTIGDACVCTI